MSGGAYDYTYSRIVKMQEKLAAREQVDPNGLLLDYRGQTVLRRRFCRLLGLVAEACRAIEWNDSGDGDDREEALIRRCLRGARVTKTKGGR